MGRRERQNAWLKAKRRSARGQEVRENARRYRARQAGVEVKPVPADWEQQQLARQNNSCHWCGYTIGQELVRIKGQLRIDFEADHVVPLSEGGEHSPDNMVLACVGCNAKRGGQSTPRPTYCRPAPNTEEVL